MIRSAKRLACKSVCEWSILIESGMTREVRRIVLSLLSVERDSNVIFGNVLETVMAPFG